MPQLEAAARVLGPDTRIGGKYALAKQIAHGGMGDVWLAKNETTQAYVALKILRPAADERTQAEDRFRREARLGGLLVHRSIVRIFDFLEEPDGTLVLVMELLRGETLEQFIARRGALSQREALAIALAVLSALQHGHDQGVVHRDVKPANIFLAVEPDGHVLPKLLDYGIAKMPKSDSKTLDGLVLGTPSYMSPEQIRSEEGIDGRSDLFSAAVCLYEMLTGTCPFAAPTPSAAIAAVLQNAVDPDPNIDPRLWVEIQRALAKRPRQRHASASELAKGLCAASGETEDSLSTALRGIAPREAAPQSGIASSPPPPRGPESGSVAGQSVANRIPRRGVSWIPWALAGALVGTMVVLAGTALHAPSKASVVGGGEATPAVVDDAEERANARSTPATSDSEMNVHSSVPAATPTPAAIPAASPPPGVVARPSHRRHRPKPAPAPTPQPPPTPRSIATSPGF